MAAVIKDDLIVFARRALGFPSSGTMTAHLEALVEDMTEKAFRMVWLPALLPGQTMGHQWSFNKGTTVFFTRAPYSTGTISIAADSTTVTGVDTVFPAASITSASILVNDQLFEVASRDSNTQLTLVSTAGCNKNTPDTAISGASYQLVYINYAVSTGAGNLGPITYAPNFGDGPIKVVADTIIDDLRQANIPNSGRPEYASVSNGTVKLWPVPDAEYQLRFQYLTDIGTASDTTSPMPNYCDDCVYAAMSVCIAEHLGNGDANSARAYFLQRLTHAVAADKAIKSLEYGDFLGYNGDRSDGMSRMNRPRLYTSDVTVYQNNRNSI